MKPTLILFVVSAGLSLDCLVGAIFDVSCGFWLRNFVFLRIYHVCFTLLDELLLILHTSFLMLPKV